LPTSQQYKCTICENLLTKSSLVSPQNNLEIDHEPALYEIKNKLWHQILKDYNLSADKLLSLKKKGESSTDLDDIIIDSNNALSFLENYWPRVKKSSIALLYIKNVIVRKVRSKYVWQTKIAK